MAEAGLMFSLTVGTWTGICTSGPCSPSTQKGDGGVGLGSWGMVAAWRDICKCRPFWKHATS